MDAMLKPFTDVPFDTNTVANSFELLKIPIVEVSFESSTVLTMFELSTGTNIFEPKYIKCPFALFTFFKWFDSSTILKSFKLCTKLETFALWSITNSFELHASVEKLTPSLVGKSFVSPTVARLHDDGTTLCEGSNVANISLMRWTERHSPTSLLRPSISTNIILTAHKLCKWLSRSSKRTLFGPQSCSGMLSIRARIFCFSRVMLRLIKMSGSKEARTRAASNASTSVPPLADMKGRLEDMWIKT
uniref:Uncharacterized protein n=1 Tax=Timema shepardi TaxID=629360 RepID=A0A7R9ARB1_TIMSH|nr:unnamed protein product [Timema shepardi]